MSSWTHIAILLVLWSQWPRSIGQIVDSPIFTDTISLTIYPSSTSQFVMSSTVVPESCPPVDPLLHGNFIYRSGNCDPISVGCSVKYTCNTGYVISGNDTRSCTRFGWDNLPPTCQIVSCGLALIEHGVGLPADQFEYEDSVVFTCDTGYELSGEANSTCQLDGTWSGDRECIFKCEEPTIRNGNVNYTCLEDGCVATYSCDDGFDFVGTTPRRCTEGLPGWTGPNPDCTSSQVESQENLELNFDPDAIDWQAPNITQELEAEIFKKLNETLGDSLHAVIIQNIFQNNGTVQFWVVIDDTTAAKQQLSSAFGGIVTGEPFEIQGANLTSDISTLNGKTEVLTDASMLDVLTCDTYEYLNGMCPATEPCTVLVDLPACVEPVKADNLWLILLLSIGIPLVLLGILIALCCYCCCCRPVIADDISDDEPPLAIKGFLPRYLPLPIAFNNAGMRGPIYGYSGSNNFDDDEASAFRSSSSRSSRSRPRQSRSSHSRSSRS